MIIIGSLALKFYGKNVRPVKDIDIWFSANEIDKTNINNLGINVLLDTNPNDLTFDTHIIPDEILDIIPNENGYASPDAIYTIKCSHFAWDIKWWEN